MNILQVNNANCAPESANDNTGINRVVTTLCKYYVLNQKDTCHIAYYRENRLGQSEFFTSGFHLKIPLQKEEFANYLRSNDIDVIQVNVSDEIFVDQIPSICAVAHQCNVKVIYCIHFMPGYQAYSYGTFGQALYNCVHKKNALDGIKKWIMTITRPISSKLINRVIKSRYCLPLAACDKVVVFAEPYIQQFLDVAKSDAKEKFAVIPNPLSFSQYITQNELRCKAKNVIVVGRLYEAQKRLTAVLKIWRKVENNPLLQDWNLTLIGEGTSGDYYKWLAAKYNLKNIHFVGRQDPIPYYRRASILLSTSAYEGWPMILMECMPMGVVPCVFNSYGAAKDIISHKQNGMLSPEYDLKAFYQNLILVMQNDEMRHNLAVQAIESSRRFDVSIIGQKWHQLFEELTKTE